MSGMFFLDLDKISQERYDMAKFLEYTDNFDPLTSSFMTDLVNLPQNGSYEVRGEDQRPDLLSYKIYNNTQYWWVLMMYNRKFEFSEFKTGDIITYPSLEDVDNMFFSLKAKQTASTST